MKGLKVTRALPSNAIDIYALLKEAQKEGVLYGKPSERQVQHYYFSFLINELCHPLHLWFVARRGRGYLGFVHGIAPPGRWDGSIECLAVDLVYVTKNRRKSGIGRKLLDEVKKEAQNMGIKRFEFLSSDLQQAYWEKERKAQKIQNLMGVSL